MDLVHIAFILRPGSGKSTLFLRKLSDQRFCWFEEKSSQPGIEEDLQIEAINVEEALRLARRKLAPLSFRTLICGFRFSLPERDEHGINALFHQMAASYQAPGGIYFDAEVGHNCIVHNSSLEAQQLLRVLKKQNRL